MGYQIQDIAGCAWRSLRKLQGQLHLMFVFPPFLEIILEEASTCSSLLLSFASIFRQLVLLVLHMASIRTLQYFKLVTWGEDPWKGSLYHRFQCEIEKYVNNLDSFPRNIAVKRPKWHEVQGGCHQPDGAGPWQEGSVGSQPCSGLVREG